MKHKKRPRKIRVNARDERPYPGCAPQATPARNNNAARVPLATRAAYKPQHTHTNSPYIGTPTAFHRARERKIALGAPPMELS